MTWHVRTPWAAKLADTLDLIRRIRQIAEAAERGDIAPAKAIHQIEDLARGEADRIVTVPQKETRDA
jgi:hypothetical protein